VASRRPARQRYRIEYAKHSRGRIEHEIVSSALGAKSARPPHPPFAVGFSHIHLVAHGTTSRLSRRDSAIVLFKNAVETNSFKLYARDIIQRPMNANLATIAACYGAGSHAYSGEGLVDSPGFSASGGLQRNPSLCEVTDASTERLMDLYDEMDEGASADAALRAAKLALLHGNAFRNPSDWAAF
jgi:CHAT domain-containing protein